METIKKTYPRKATDNSRKIDIENCELSFKCTAKWGDLKPTKVKSVRHCADCRRDVHYCTTYDELKVAVEKNYCVAVDAADRPDRMVKGEMFPNSIAFPVSKRP